MSRKAILYAVLLVCCVPFVFPTWWMATASLKPVNEIFAFPPSVWPHVGDPRRVSARSSSCSRSGSST